jgi:ABC-type sugar transport system ATPase subunit
MDEPLSNLDAKLRVQTRAELIELHRRLATTFVYVTHDQVEAMTMGDRIAVMSDGVLQQVGPPQAVYEKPANVFVARFIGNPPMSTLDATVARDDDGVAVEVAGGRLLLPDALGRAVVERGVDQVVVGVRPEHLHLDQGPIKATVAVVESLGHERHVVCRLDDRDMVVVRQPSSEPAPADGTVVGLRPDAERLHLFEATTGERVDPA